MTDRPSLDNGARDLAFLPWLFLIVPVGIGLWIGRDIAYREGETGNAFYTIGHKVIAAGLALLFALIAAIAFGLGRRRVAAIASASAVVLLAATFVAAQAANPLGLGYRAPVVATSDGVATLALDGVTGFVAKEASVVRCASAPDSTATSSVEGLDLGELNAGTLRGTLSLDATTTGHLELFVDGADLSEGAAQPVWTGVAQLEDLAGDATAGTAAFTKLAYSDPDVAKGGPAPTDGKWPAALSGTLRWDCRQ